MEAVGKSGRGVGAGDRWLKSGDWELGNHIIELRCFDFKLKWVKVCSKFDWRFVINDALYITEASLIAIAKSSIHAVVLTVIQTL